MSPKTAKASAEGGGLFATERTMGAIQRLDRAKEILQEGQTGFVVPTQDPAAIAEKIRYLYNNPEQLSEMSERCRDAISKQLSCATTANAYAHFFESLLTPQN